jgi:hypothetical protein
VRFGIDFALSFSISVLHNVRRHFILCESCIAYLRNVSCAHDVCTNGGEKYTASQPPAKPAITFVSLNWVQPDCCPAVSQL